MLVKKRNGKIVSFEKKKIVEAILKAMKEVDEINSNVADKIANEISQMDWPEISVEEIQDIVEEKLMTSKKAKKVAKAYIRYRYKKEVAREQKDTFFNAISEKLEARNVQNQNANVDEHSFGGRMGEATDVMTKQYALEYCVSEKSKNNHLNNEIYIHDLSHYAVGCHNCLSIPFDDLLAKGFNTRQTDVRPANSVNTAFQLVAVIFQLQSLQQFGGVSATHLDWTMVPYVRKSFAKHFKNGLKYIENVSDECRESWDIIIPEKWSINREQYKDFSKAYKYAMDMTIKEIYQAAEGLFHNLNTLQSRSGN